MPSKVYYSLFLLMAFKLKAQLDSLTSSTRFLSFAYENDVFAGTDRYYTQGVQLTFVHPLIKRSPVSTILIHLKNRTNTIYGLALEQNCFTPRSILYKGIFYEERPYSGTVFLSHHLTSFNENKQFALKTQLDLGAIGPCALCKEEQKAIHRATGDAQPLGWENQIKNDVYLNYSVGFEKGIIQTKYFQTILQSSIRAGTIHNDVSAGINLRLGITEDYFKPHGFGKATRSNYQLFLTLKAKAKFIAHNATLQGGVFTKNNAYTLNANQITRLVYDAGTYLVFSYKRLGIECGYSYLSPEFEKGLEHGWGKCALLYWY